MDVLHLCNRIWSNKSSWLGLQRKLQDQKNSDPRFQNFAAGRQWGHIPGNVVVPIGCRKIKLLGEINSKWYLLPGSSMRSFLFGPTRITWWSHKANWSIPHGDKDKGLIINPYRNSFDCYVDADFCGNRDQDTAEDDPTTAKSRTGYVIKYAGCPIVWQSKLQTEVAQSTTEAEYIALSTALCDVTSLMYLLEEAMAQGIPNVATIAQVHCRVFEDNSGALELARVPKMWPRTKHLNHFHERGWTTFICMLT